MTTMTTTTVLFGDRLLDTQLPVAGGVEIVSTPAMAVGGLLVYPRPRVSHDESGRPTLVVLDLGCWLISLPGSVSLPMECASPQAVLQAADVLADNLDRRIVDIDSPADLSAWVASWCARHTDATPLPTGPISLERS